MYSKGVVTFFNELPDFHKECIMNRKLYMILELFFYCVSFNTQSMIVVRSYFTHNFEFGKPFEPWGLRSMPCLL